MLQKNSLPYPVASKYVTSPFGPRKAGIGADEFHDGTDFRARFEQFIAVDSGVVVRIASSSGYGLYMIVQHEGYCVLYAHLETRYVSAGEPVSKGQILGETGDSGTKSPHLHFEIRTGVYDNSFWNKDGDKFVNSVDPMDYIKTHENLLSADEIIELAVEQDEKWQKGVESLKTLVSAPSDLGDLEIMNFFDELIVKVYYLNK